MLLNKEAVRTILHSTSFLYCMYHYVLDLFVLLLLCTVNE